MMKRVDSIHLSHDAARTAIVDRGRDVSFAALEEAISAVAGNFLKRGIRQGDRVGVWLGKTTEMVVTLLAVMRAGAIAIPINPVLKGPQVDHILADSDARLLLTNAGRKGLLLATGGCDILSVEEDWQALSHGEPAPDVLRDADDLAAILYTSGSTGRPKGVMLSHSNLVLGAESVAEYLEIGPDDRTLCVLPFSFDYGLNQLLTALLVGGTAVLFDYLLPRDVVKAIAKYRITGLAGVPPLWMQLIDVDWPEAARGLRYITNSGGRMPVALTQKYRDLMPDTRIVLMYGLTEAFRSTYLDPALVDEHPESIGVAIPNAEVHVLRADGSLADPDEAGELVHAGPLVAQGYWNDPERTAERFRPAPEFAHHAGRAVWSGDTVVRRKNGLLYFVGRDDEMIKTSGNRVSPTEIEEAAFDTGAVRVAAAFGVDDDRLGQAIIMIATPADGLNTDEAEAKLKSGLGRSLPVFMQPKEIHWIDDMPRNPNGKIDRNALRKRLSL